MRAAIVLFACAGCIQPSLLQCGDQLCPSSNICLDDAVCATPEQIAACADLPDAASCHTSNGDGYCTHGVCAPNLCGDGQVTGVEPCDGTSVSLTCADFGYYTGTTSCSPLCTIDRSNCSGRCGDGVIDLDQGEECDGAPPDESCVDVGFDYGALTCGAVTCAADPVHSCSRFGWHKVGAISYPAQVVGDAGMFAALNNSFIEVHEATVTTHPGMYIAIDARGGDLLAATSSTVETYHAGVWTTLPPPTLTGDQKIVEANIAVDGTPHVLVTGATSCAIGWFDGAAWTLAPGPVGCSHLAARAIGDFAVAVSDGSVRRQFPGCIPASPGNPCECLRTYTIGDGTSTIFALDIQATNTNVYARQASTGTITSTIAPECGGGPSAVTLGTNPAMKFVLRAPGEVFAMQNSSFNTTAFRIANNRVETIASATSITGEPPDLYATRDGVVYAQGDGTLYRLGDLTETQRVPPPDLAQPPTSRLALAADGTYVTCAEHVAETTSATATFQTLGSLGCPTGTGCCNALYARSATSIYASMTPSATPALYAWNGATWTTQMLGSSAIGKVTSLAGAGTIVVGVRDTGDVIELSGGAWMLLPALPGTAAVVAVANDGTIYAGGRDATGGAIWAYDNIGAWLPVQQHDDPSLGYTSLSIASDGSMFAAMGQSIDIGVGTSWTSYANAGAVVAAVSATDAFSTTAAVPVHVNHWDGSRWAPINVTADDFFFEVAASASDVVVFGSLRVSNPNPVWQGFIRVPH